MDRLPDLASLSHAEKEPEPLPAASDPWWGGGGSPDNTSEETDAISRTSPVGLAFLVGLDRLGGPHARMPCRRCSRPARLQRVGRRPAGDVAGRARGDTARAPASSVGRPYCADRAAERGAHAAAARGQGRHARRQRPEWHHRPARHPGRQPSGRPEVGPASRFGSGRVRSWMRMRHRRHLDRERPLVRRHGPWRRGRRTRLRCRLGSPGPDRAAVASPHSPRSLPGRSPAMDRRGARRSTR